MNKELPFKDVPGTDPNVLEYVLIEYETPGRVRMTASNNIVVATALYDADFDERFKPSLVPAFVFENIIAQRRKGGPETLSFDPDDPHAPYGGAYPDWRKQIPKEGEQHHHAHLSLEGVNLTMAQRAIGTPWTNIVFGEHRNGPHLVVSPNHGDFAVILGTSETEWCPVRLKDYVPELKLIDRMARYIVHDDKTGPEKMDLLRDAGFILQHQVVDQDVAKE